jgi:alpha-tubulin suppressor-like RCC1 family protein
MVSYVVVVVLNIIQFQYKYSYTHHSLLRQSNKQSFLSQTFTEPGQVQSAEAECAKAARISEN